MCYTSGTTGNPKGVVYSHRSTLLHSLITLTADGLGLSERDVLMPVVPMFHVNAWGLPYAALLAGSSMVFPGPNMTPKGVLGLLERHRVTVTAGVPTIWLGALPLLKDYDLSAVQRILCGGSAVPRALSEAYRKAGVPILHAWGMTETSPVATVASSRTQDDALDDDARADARVRQGQPIPLVELRVIDPVTGETVPSDDETSGEIQAAGPWIASQYFRDESGATQFTDDGWFRTGDVATVDRYGCVKIVDRTKDLVKSGGEWISSVQLENAIMAHPKVVEAAVIGVPHERWVAGRWPASCSSRARPSPSRSCAHTSSRSSRAGGCPTPWSSSTRCPRPASASSPSAPAGEVRRFLLTRAVPDGSGRTIGVAQARSGPSTAQTVLPPACSVTPTPWSARRPSAGRDRGPPSGRSGRAGAPGPDGCRARRRRGPRATPIESVLGPGVVDGVRHQLADHHGGVLGEVVVDAPLLGGAPQERAGHPGRGRIGGQEQLAVPVARRPGGRDGPRLCIGVQPGHMRA